MKFKSFLQKNWIHFVALIVMLTIVSVYFSPQLDGNLVKQHDTEQWRGMANEVNSYRNKTGEEPLWTNSMFGGMPSIQISVIYAGNLVKSGLNLYFKMFNGPMGITLLHMIGFYIFALFLRINPLIGLAGAIAYSFASYEIIIIQAGHTTKAIATAFLAPILGAFIASYRSDKRWIPIALSALLMSLELAANHVQVTYYLVLLLVIVGIYFLIDAILKKKIKRFAITSVALIGAYVLAFFINSGNILLTNDYASATIRGKNDVTIAPDGTKEVNQSAGLDKDYITQWSYGKGETFTLLSPNIKGGGSFPIADSQFEEIVLDSDSRISKDALRFGAYWGEQPFTSGPVYIGVVVVFLAFLGLFFIKSKIKWALFVATILAIMLSWGKNFMGLTDFMIDYFPGYNKFRTVTIILVLVELTIPVLGVMFLDRLIKEKEAIKEKKVILFSAIGFFIVFLYAVKLIGIDDSYLSERESNQLADVELNIRAQIAEMNPQELKTNYNLDVNNSVQVDRFVDAQMESYEASFQDLKSARKAIFHNSMSRSITFTFLSAIFIIAFLYLSVPGYVLGGVMVILIGFDVIPVAADYLGKQENPRKRSELKYWVDAGEFKYPVSATSADYSIMEMELAQNSELKSKIDRVEKEARQEASELNLSPSARRNYIDSKKFAELNFSTNYRVFDVQGAFQSSRASYFHKSLGGYHGAKLRNINNLFNFHITSMNNKVFNMLNVKYFLQPAENGAMVVKPNPGAMGNAWLVQTVETYETPDDEIRALGTTFSIENIGNGILLVNGENKATEKIYGREELKYVRIASDTISVRVPNDLPDGVNAYFVVDAKGQANFVSEETFNNEELQGSFNGLIKVSVDNTFKPNTEVVMLESEADKLSKKMFTGKGEVRMTSYAPNKIEYTANVEGDQFAVFSEIYYKDGWKAFVDGKEVPIIKSNYLLRGVELPSGKHKVEMIFDLPKFHTANTIAFIGSIVLILFIGWAVYYEKFKKVAKTEIDQ